MNIFKHYVKTAVCMALSAAMVFTDVPATVLAAGQITAEGQSESEAESEIHEAETTEETVTETDSAEQTADETSGEEKETETESAKETGETQTQDDIKETEETQTKEHETETKELLTGETDLETEALTESEAETEEVLQKLAFSDSDIAHGEYRENGNNIEWVIDKDGNLTVEGTGDFDRHSFGYGPWYENRESIKTAVVNVTGMTNAQNMFNGCTNLTSVDVSGFDTKNVTDMKQMFSGCENLASVDISGFDTGNVTDMSSMFFGCKNLTSVNVNGANVNSFDTGSVTTMKQMFCGCENLISVDVSGFNTRNVTDMSNMFKSCYKLTNPDVSGFDTGNVTDMSDMFILCRNLTNLDVSNFKTENVTNMSNMFSNCESLTSLNVSGFKTGNVTDMSNMFSSCKKLTSLDVSGFDTGNVTDMSSMFNLCEKLTSLNVSSFNTENVTNMSSMFMRCVKLDSIDVSGFDTRNVTDMSGMFDNCQILPSMDVSGFDTGNVTDMSSMFAACHELTNLDVSSFDTSRVTNMNSMFWECWSLTSLDISGFDMDNVTGANQFVLNCSSICSIYVPRNCHIDLDLPESQNAWQDLKGNKYVKFPTGLSESILLIREGDTVNPKEKITVRMRKSVYYCNDIIGEDDFIVRYYDSDGTVRELSQTEYTISPETIDTSKEGKYTLTVKYNTLTAQVTITIKKPQKSTVQIMGIKISSRTYNKEPVSYTGTAVVLTGDETEVTEKVQLVYTYTGRLADNTAYESTDAPTNAGSYKLTVAVSQDSAEYTGSSEFDFTITKAPLTITAHNMVLKMGAELPKAEDYEYDVTGLFTGDSLTKEPEFACSIASTAEPGTYDIIVSGADAGMNYDITYEKGTLTVGGLGDIAQYYTVIFNLSGKGDDIVKTGVEEGSLLQRPEDPQAEGYTFTGWYKDKECTVIWDFAKDTVQSDTTLYAGWKKKEADNENKNDAAWHVGDIGSAVYTGSSIKPKVDIYASDGTLLKSGTHYTVTYQNNTDADKVTAEGGTGTSESDSTGGFNKSLPYVIITGKGNYAGSVYKNFHITPAAITDDGETPAKGFTLKCTEQFVTANKEQKPFISIKYKKAMAAGTDYDVEFSKYTESGSLQLITSGSTIPSIPANDTGKFMLVIKGKGNYSGTIEKKIYVGGKDDLMKNAKITLGKNIKSFKYRGSDIEPSASANNTDKDAFTVKLGNKYLTPRTDYTVSYRNNRAVGTATIIVTGTGNYIGTKTATFKITGTPFKAKDATINNFEASKTYTGSAIEQGKSGLKIGDKSLKYGTDYTVTYKNNTKKGTATVTFRADPESGYSGSFNKTFKITAADMSAVTADFQNYEVTGSGADRKLDKNVAFSKAGAKPSGSYTLKDANGNTLIQGTDYTVSYSNNKKVGAQAVMTIKGKGSYTGKITVKYTIEKAALDGNINLAQTCTPVAYNAAKADNYLYKPKFKVTDGKKALSAKTDYKALTGASYINCTQNQVKAYLDALENGNAPENMRPYLVIEAADNGGYKGSMKVYLTIYKAKLTKNNVDVQITGGDVYAGKQVTPTVTVTLKTENKALIEGRDYTLSYGTNIAAGRNKGSVTISGTGLYGGNVTVKFDIKSKDIN